MDLLASFGVIAANGFENIWLWAGNFLILLILTGILIGFSYRGGRGRIISLIVAFYAGYALYIVFPYTDDIVNASGSTTVKAIITIALYLAATFVPYHFIQRLTSGGFGVLSLVPRVILSFLAAAFLLALSYHVFYLSNIYSFPSPIDSLFAPDAYFFWWFIAPLVALVFLVR